ncbi:hypothetical protein C0Q70_11388 [Pomacea canaliculata]|uniref:Cystatin domain-containing protein n=1 Tax=Pomacea canaliculata TaxID=400727 RepID=A0A2T7P5X5_POMCA|nr:cystatin-B-like [Pomacea canaliculata]PVD28793.1 hypothetical protein C0Q70_11388 [Pomacea canaliculata]
MRKCGGTSEVKQADEEIQSLCEKIRSDLESKANRSLSADSFKAVSYKSQVVAGTNYFVKIDVGDGEFIHVRIFQALPCNGGNISLHSFQDGKSLEEDIAYF